MVEKGLGCRNMDGKLRNHPWSASTQHSPQHTSPITTNGPLFAPLQLYALCHNCSLSLVDSNVSLVPNHALEKQKMYQVRLLSLYCSTPLFNHFSELYQAHYDARPPQRSLRWLAEERVVVTFLSHSP